MKLHGFDEAKIVMVMVLILMALSLFFHFGTPGVGEQAGYVTESERAGLLWSLPHITIAPTQFSQGGMSYSYGSDEVIFNSSWNNVGRKVVVGYECHFIVPAWKYSNACVAGSLRVVE